MPELRGSGLVVGQRPAAGAVVADGARVRVVLERPESRPEGPPTAPEPPPGPTLAVAESATRETVVR